jgi:uncharacterized protein (DUF1330 family)
VTKAYVIGHIAVKDAEKWAEYRNQVPADPWRHGALNWFFVGSEPRFWPASIIPIPTSS